MSSEDQPLLNELILESLSTREELIDYLHSKDYPLERVFNSLEYETKLADLQAQLVRLQHWVIKKKQKVAIIFEGRDAAGKGGSIRRFTEHLNPRHMRVVALSKPTDAEKGQWYFRRYIKELPNKGEIVFFDRSWYNRAVVEPVMGFCTKKQYERFMMQVHEFELMIHEDGVDLIKFWFDIDKEEQNARFLSRETDKLKQWKLSPVDKKAQEKWDEFTKYKELMFMRTHTSHSPWVVVQANDKRIARIESIRYVLSNLMYPKDNGVLSLISPNPNVVYRYNRQQFS